MMIFITFSLPNIFRMIKSGRMRWVGYVANIVEKRNAYRALVGTSEGKRLLQTLIGGMIILKWILEK
jgi:hypothetical protein